MTVETRTKSFHISQSTIFQMDWSKVKYNTRVFCCGGTICEKVSMCW